MNPNSPKHANRQFSLDGKLKDRLPWLVGGGVTSATPGCEELTFGQEIFVSLPRPGNGDLNIVDEKKPPKHKKKKERSKSDDRKTRGESPRLSLNALKKKKKKDKKRDEEPEDETQSQRVRRAIQRTRSKSLPPSASSLNRIRNDDKSTGTSSGRPQSIGNNKDEEETTPLMKTKKRKSKKKKKNEYTKLGDDIENLYSSFCEMPKEDEKEEDDSANDSTSDTEGTQSPSPSPSPSPTRNRLGRARAKRNKPIKRTRSKSLPQTSSLLKSPLTCRRGSDGQLDVLAEDVEEETKQLQKTPTRGGRKKGSYNRFDAPPPSRRGRCTSKEESAEATNSSTTLGKSTGRLRESSGDWNSCRIPSKEDTLGAATGSINDGTKSPGPTSRRQPRKAARSPMRRTRSKSLPHGVSKSLPNSSKPTFDIEEVSELFRRSATTVATTRDWSDFERSPGTRGRSPHSCRANRINNNTTTTTSSPSSMNRTPQIERPVMKRNRSNSLTALDDKKSNKQEATMKKESIKTRSLSPGRKRVGKGAIVAAASRVPAVPWGSNRSISHDEKALLLQQSWSTNISDNSWETDFCSHDNWSDFELSPSTRGRSPHSCPANRINNNTTTTTSSPSSMNRTPQIERPVMKRNRSNSLTALDDKKSNNQETTVKRESTAKTRSLSPRRRKRIGKGAILKAAVVSRVRGGSSNRSRHHDEKTLLLQQQQSWPTNSAGNNSWERFSSHDDDNRTPPQIVVLDHDDDDDERVGFHQHKHNQPALPPTLIKATTVLLGCTAKRNTHLPNKNVETDWHK